MLPEGWCAIELSADVRIHAGIAPSDLNILSHGRIPYVKVEDLNNTDKIQFVSRTYVDNEKCAVPAGCVIFPKRGAAIFANKVRIAGVPMVLDTNLMAVECTGELEPEFLYYAISHAGLHKLADTSSIPQLNNKHVLPYRLNRPGRLEQKEIAGVLATWDNAIVTIEKLLANSRRQKQALISKNLMAVPTTNRKRAASDAYPPSVQSGLPQLPPTPKGWRMTTLGQHLREVVRPAHLEPDRSYRLVTVRRSRGGVDERSTLLGSEIKTPTQFYVKAGDFLISKRQIVHGACGVVPPELDGAIVSNEYAVLNTTDDLDIRFLCYLSETTYFQQTCFHSSIGVHIEKMLFRLDKWLKWSFNLPPLAEQQRIVRLLDIARAQELAIQVQLNLLKEEKKTLMADLLTGRRRVKSYAVHSDDQD